MINFTTIGGRAFALVLTEPNWASPIGVTLGTVAEVDASIAGNEVREVFTDNLRYEITYRPMVAQEQATQFRGAMRKLKGQPVAVPYWPDRRLVSSIEGAELTLDFAPKHTSNRFVLWDENNRFEVVTCVRASQNGVTVIMTGETAVDWYGTEYTGEIWAAPLLMGRTVTRPRATSLTDEHSDMDVTVKESAEFANRLAPVAVAFGTVGAAVPGFDEVSLFPVRPTFTEPEDASTLSINYASIGFQREMQVAYHDAQPRAGNTMKFLLEADDAHKLEAFFLARSGPVSTFFLPTFRGDLRLNQDVPVAATSIYCDRTALYEELGDVNRHPGAPFIAVIDRANIRPYRVTGQADGGDMMELELPVVTNAAFSKLDSIVSHLQLCRFANGQIRLNYLTDMLAEVEIDFVEVAEEYNGLTGELARRLFLYRFTTDIEGYGPWNYTSDDQAHVAPILVESEGGDGSFSLVLCLDETGSIGEGGAQAGLDVLNQYEDRISQVALVAFGDEVRTLKGFISVATMRAYLEDVLAYVEPAYSEFFFDGGGDWPENGIDALQNCLDLFVGVDGLRYIYFITDTPSFAHEVNSPSAVVAQLNAQGIYTWMVFDYEGSGEGDGNYYDTDYATVFIESTYILLTPFPDTGELPGAELENVTFVPGPFEHGGLKHALNLETEQVDLVTWQFEGNPVLRMLTQQLERPLMLTIYETTIANPTGVDTMIFRGECGKARASGERITVKCVAIGSKTARQLPWFLFQQTCNHQLYTVGTCGVAIASFTYVGEITGLVADAFYIDVDSITNSGGGKADNFFAMGWLEAGTGLTKQFRAILRSENRPGTVQRLFLHRPLVGLANGAAVTFYPGCDKNYVGAGGCSKFGAGKEDRFGGFPAMPTENPSVRALPLKPDSGGSK